MTDFNLIDKQTDAYQTGEDGDRQESRREDVWLRPVEATKRKPAASDSHLARLVNGSQMNSLDLGNRRERSGRDTNTRLKLSRARRSRPVDDNDENRRPRTRFRRPTGNNKHSIGKRIKLTSSWPMTAQASSPDSSASLDNNKDEDFAIDDGDEDAWVHDGIDDIHIDPETKRAANEVSQDNSENSNIDSEYDPASGQQQPSSSSREEQQQEQQLGDGESIRTIARVIPVN